MKSKTILPEEERAVIKSLKLTNNYHFLKTWKALEAAESEVEEKQKALDYAIETNLLYEDEISSLKAEIERLKKEK